MNTLERDPFRSWVPLVLIPALFWLASCVPIDCDPSLVPATLHVVGKYQDTALVEYLGNEILLTDAERAIGRNSGCDVSFVPKENDPLYKVGDDPRPGADVFDVIVQ